MRKRTVVLFVILNFLFFCSVCSVANVVTQFSYTASVSQNSVKLEIDRCRGTIYDCNLFPITNSTYEYYAAVPPGAQALAEIKNYKIEKGAAERLKSGYPALVQVDSSFSSKIIDIFKVPVYNKYQLCNHIVGYLGANGEGIAGIEKAYNKSLSGGTLSVRFPCTSQREVLSGKETLILNDNYNYKKGVVLTIDKTIQRIAKSAVEKYINRGAVVILDVKTGNIKAMVSAPDIDINNLEVSLKDENSPFLNRAISPFSVGSVFKLCVGAAALQKDVSLNYTCVGRCKVGDRYFHCQNQKAHGDVDFSTALSLSCNCYFITLGQKVGADAVYKMMQSMSFGVTKRIAKDMVALGGTLPERADVVNNPSSLANLCIGQGMLTATPLQIASMVQCIANDGAMYSPKLVLGYMRKSGKLKKEKQSSPTYILSKEVATTLKNAMIQTVESGTGKSAKPEFFGAGGKTATAETGQEDVNMTWFAGFYPAESPKYAIVVLAENGISGGQSAAPVFKTIADKLK